ncbi:ThiF family adenylyltransferase [Massilia sp. H6]|uniref:ThiF family adenylyltransferase n=1 Tax=Massilia sp. H6 TaxID=2970464 RepID=UPI00216A6637|nr:ThiF family adenylyltransferase [Massilia sp. H6]UVW29398.1 ThiF family adenylyltransferase [Massilia sp. H6]
MNKLIQDRLLALMREGRDRLEATDWFRVGLGLHYLAGLMTEEEIDFKLVDRAFNRFIYHTLGKGHSIASVLQFMSGEKVMPTVECARFMQALRSHCPEIPVESIPFLLELNLGVAKNISGLDPDGPLADWVARQKALAAGPHGG